MDPLEIRLSGREATLSGVIRAVDRQLVRGALTRIELRYSSQCREKLEAGLVQSKLSNLLKERGAASIAISVRPHRSLLDDAAAEHLLRLFPVAKEDLPAKPSGWWSRFWSKSGLSLKSDAVQAEHDEAGGKVSASEAAACFRQAIANAVERQARRQPGGVVRGAKVVVRTEELNRELSRLIAGDERGALESLRRTLTASGLTFEGASLRYTFCPRKSGDGTSYADDDDVEIQLSMDGPVLDAMPHNIEPQPATALPAFGATLLPRAARTGQVSVSILGTTGKLLDQPVALGQWDLPLRIDRDFLSRHTPAHLAEFANVASNSCPLTVKRQGGDMVLHAPQRERAGAPSVAMYYERDGTPLAGEVTLPLSGRDLLVNSPEGAMDPKSGRVLPALVLALVAA